MKQFSLFIKASGSVIVQHDSSAVWCSHLSDSSFYFIRNKTCTAHQCGDVFNLSVYTINQQQQRQEEKTYFCALSPGLVK